MSNLTSEVDELRKIISGQMDTITEQENSIEEMKEMVTVQILDVLFEIGSEEDEDDRLYQIEALKREINLELYNY